MNLRLVCLTASTLCLLALAAVCVLSLPAPAAAPPAATPAAAEPPPPPPILATEQDQALAAEFRRLQETITEPAATELLHAVAPWMPNMVAQLAGEKPASEDALAKARKAIGDRVKELQNQVEWPDPKSFTFARAKGPIVIDGVLDDDAWKDVPAHPMPYELNAKTPGADAPVSAVRLLWDDEYLYFAFACEDSEIDAPKLERDGPVYDYDCVEVFVMPNPRWGMYWELNLSPSKSQLDRVYTKYRRQFGSYRLEGEQMQGLKWETTLTGPADAPTGYIVEVAMPISELPAWGGKPKAGDSMLLLCSRISRTAGKNRFYAITPICTWFHNMWAYAPATLGE